MEFRLIYRGALPAQGAGTGGSRIKEKHAIRRQFHSQLRELWHGHPILSDYVQETTNAATGKKVAYLDQIAAKYEKFGYRFLPLVSKKRGIACSLDILFLRRDSPGNLVASGGDIDNRIKVLFDGLRVPGYAEEVPSPPQEGEDPFFTLLEDDDLITDVRITTDRLLTPLESDERIHDVHLVLHAKTKVVDDRIASRMWV
jgi:hypothetical protein